MQLSKGTNLATSVHWKWGLVLCMKCIVWNHFLFQWEIVNYVKNCGFLTKSPKHSKASFFLYNQEGLATMFHKI